MSLRTSLAVGVLKGSLGSKPTLVSMPAVKIPKAPPRTNPREKKKSKIYAKHNTINRLEGIKSLKKLILIILFTTQYTETIV